MQSSVLSLVRSIRQVASELLPPDSPTASYTDGEILRMYSFRLLAHAEVEGFIEGLADEVVQALSAKNDAGRLRPPVREALMLHHALSTQFPPQTLSPKSSVGDSKTPIKNQLKTVASYILSNNGVSEKDILKLFLPLGFALTEFDRAWLSSMTQLASARGQVAHNSWSKAAKTQPSPKEERAALVLPILGLRRMCWLADELLRRA